MNKTGIVYGGNITEPEGGGEENSLVIYIVFYRATNWQCYK